MKRDSQRVTRRQVFALGAAALGVLAAACGQAPAPTSAPPTQASQAIQPPPTQAHSQPNQLPRRQSLQPPSRPRRVARSR